MRVLKFQLFTICQHLLSIDFFFFFFCFNTLLRKNFNFVTRALVVRKGSSPNHWRRVMLIENHTRVSSPTARERYLTLFLKGLK